MHKADTRVELRESGDSLLNAGHADEHQAGCALVEDGSHLLKTIHMKSVGLVHQDQSGRIHNCPLFDLILLIRFEVRGIDSRPIARGTAWLIHDLSSPLLVLDSDLFENHRRFAPDRIEHDTHHEFQRSSEKSGSGGFWWELSH
jgi:hypothetical protein